MICADSFIFYDMLNQFSFFLAVHQNDKHRHIQIYIYIVYFFRFCFFFLLLINTIIMFLKLGLRKLGNLTSNLLQILRFKKLGI